MNNFQINFEDIDVIVSDFDGVMTNNRVYLNSLGEEFVSCNRSDGLALDVLKKIGKPVFILSTEKDAVVSARAKKLDIRVIQGITNKAESLKSLSKSENFSLSNVLYIGNDINDFNAMKICGYSACPADSHKKIKQISNVTLNTKGGDGIFRELLEEILNLDLIKILYKE